MENRMSNEMETNRFRGYVGVYGLFSKLCAPFGYRLYYDT